MIGPSQQPLVWPFYLFVIHLACALEIASALALMWMASHRGKDSRAPWSQWDQWMLWIHDGCEREVYTAVHRARAAGANAGTCGPHHANWKVREGPSHFLSTSATRRSRTSLAESASPLDESSNPLASPKSSRPESVAPSCRAAAWNSQERTVTRRVPSRPVRERRVRIVLRRPLTSCFCSERKAWARWPWRRQQLPCNPRLPFVRQLVRCFLIPELARISAPRDGWPAHLHPDWSSGRLNRRVNAHETSPPFASPGSSLGFPLLSGLWPELPFFRN